ncbi:MAG TPA: MotA/TolQ/ExbB proton channel family protein [Cyclobacteriaceae bacterium]
MIELYFMGGPLFMGILTLILIAMLAVAVINGLPVIKNTEKSERDRIKIAYVKSVGLFGLIVGVLAQLIGLYQAFMGIEAMGSVSSAMLAGGLKVSMITTLYGLLIYVLSYLIWFGLSFALKKSEPK